MKLVRYLLITLIVVFFLSFVGVSHAQDTAKITFTSATPSTKPGQLMLVNVVVDSTVPVNAVEARISYPSSEFKLLSVNYANSQFSIQAQESSSVGSVTLVRGNIVPRTGKNLLATLVFESITNGNVNAFSYSDTSLVMSSNKNENILTGSEIATKQPPTVSKKTNNTPGSYPITATTPKAKKVAHQSFLDFLLQSARDSFQSIFKR